MMFSISLYWYLMGPIRDSAIEINSLTKYLNKKFTKKAMNYVYIGYLLVNLPTSNFIYLLISGYVSEEPQRMCLKEAVTYFKKCHPLCVCRT
jgi:hypothetical protein